MIRLFLLASLGLALTAAPVSAADPAAGRAKARTCINCHGLDGISRTPDAPHLSGQVEAYLVMQLQAYRDGQRQHPVMNVVAGPLTDADIEDLAAWYAGIEVTVTPPPQ